MDGSFWYGYIRWRDRKFYSINSAAFIATRDNYIKFSDRLDSKPLPIISKKGSEFDIDFIEDMNYFKKIL